jgi:hypothetical protein
MDEKDKKIAELEQQVSALTTKVQEKDVLIEQKNQDIIGARQKYKKLSEMTQEEKDLMTQQELEVKERMEMLEADKNRLEKEQQEFKQKERESRLNSVLKKYGSETNPEVAAKIKANLDKIKGAEDAFTEEEIANHVELAFNMLGEAKPDPVRAAMNGSGDVPNYDGQGNNYADSNEGKAIMDKMNIVIPETPTNPSENPTT